MRFPNACRHVASDGPQVSEVPTLIIVRNTTDADNKLWRIYKRKSYGKT